jgi:hypothetical protein
MLGKGGIAVVWLGMKDGQYFAMKQFPFKERRQVDQSARVEFQIQKIIKRYSNQEGKFTLFLFIFFI